MTARSTTSATPLPLSADQGTMDDAHRAALLAANINPDTGLATDYLNHFNEAIMLLELIPAMPECAEEFLNWRPITYADHFIASNFNSRHLAIAAYEAAPSAIRAPFDDVCGTMTAILTTIRTAVAQSAHNITRVRLAEQAVRWLKPLVANAGAMINGIGDGAGTARPQSDIDLIMSN